MNGHKCDYRKQWNEEKVNDAVAEVIKKLVNNPKFEAAIRAKINSKIDTGELETVLGAIFIRFQYDPSKKRME